MDLHLPNLGKKFRMSNQGTYGYCLARSMHISKHKPILSLSNCPTKIHEWRRPIRTEDSTYTNQDWTLGYNKRPHQSHLCVEKQANTMDHFRLRSIIRIHRLETPQSATQSHTDTNSIPALIHKILVKETIWMTAFGHNSRKISYIFVK